MWIPTQEEAVEMYARFLAARHRGSAGRYARGNAEKLLTKGDFEGYAVWNRVADALEARDKAEAVTPLS
jgi:hypothetical protein